MTEITQDKLSSAHKGFRYTVTMEGTVGNRVITANMWSRGGGRGALLAGFSCFPLEWADQMNCTCGRGAVAMRKLMGLLGEDPHFERIREKVDVIMGSRFGAASCDTPVRTGYWRKKRSKGGE
jgi:hypothetical protein